MSGGTSILGVLIMMLVVVTELGLADDDVDSHDDFVGGRPWCISSCFGASSLSSSMASVSAVMWGSRPGDGISSGGVSSLVFEGVGDSRGAHVVIPYDAGLGLIAFVLLRSVSAVGALAASSGKVLRVALASSSPVALPVGSIVRGVSCGAAVLKGSWARVVVMHVPALVAIGVTVMGWSGIMTVVTSSLLMTCTAVCLSGIFGPLVLSG